MNTRFEQLKLGLPLRFGAPGPGSSVESPESVRSNSPFQRKVTQRQGLEAGASSSSTVSAPNTPGSRRALLPRSPCGVKVFNPTVASSLTPPRIRENSSPTSTKSSGSDPTTNTKIPQSTNYLSLSRSSSPTLSNKKVPHHSRSTTPTSPMFVKLFNARLSDYSTTKESGQGSQRSSLTLDDMSGSSPSYHLLSTHISPCSSPAIREFRKKTSPSLINLKSPNTSRRNSKNLYNYSPTPCSPSPVLSASSLSPKSFYSSPDYNSNISSNESPEVKGGAPSPALSTDVSIFSFNIKDNSEGNTPMITPVLTPRSPLSQSLLNFSFRSKSSRPVSPLVTFSQNSDEKSKEEDRLIAGDKRFKASSLSERALSKSLSLTMELDKDHNTRSTTDSVLAKLYLKITYCFLSETLQVSVHKIKYFSYQLLNEDLVISITVRGVTRRTLKASVMGSETIMINQELIFQVPSSELEWAWLRGSLDTRHTDGRIEKCFGYFASSLAQLQTAIAVFVTDSTVCRYIKVVHLHRMKVIASQKTNILKNTFSQNVNESFDFDMVDIERSFLRVELKSKILNCKADPVIAMTRLGPRHLGEGSGLAQWESAVVQPLESVSQWHTMMDTPARSSSSATLLTITT